MHSCETTHVLCDCGEHYNGLIVAVRNVRSAAPLLHAMGVHLTLCTQIADLESCPYRIGTVHIYRQAVYADAGVRSGVLARASARDRFLWVCTRCVRLASAKSAAAAALLGMQFCTPTMGPVHARLLRLASTSMFGPSHVTWLILPVVICLSQRLSHACLSISFYTVKLRMAH